ncbi:MAG: SUF system Fe-S cluster assembly protein [Gemmataceae bacterium]
MDNQPAERFSLQLSGEKKMPQPKPAPAGATLEEKVIAALRSVYDPEIPVNIYELGLVYDINADPATGKVGIRMTLTTPACPVAGSLPGEVESRVKAIPEVQLVEVDLVWDPPWDKDMMSDAAKLQLGMFD